MVYPITKAILWPILKIFIKKINGLENIPDEPFILASNHESYIDASLFVLIVAWYKNKKIRYVATNEYFLGPFWDRFFRHYGAIRINGSVDKALQALKEGDCIGIFPEGQRTYNDKIQKVKHTGLGVLALQSKVPVVPAGINTYDFWNRYMFFLNPKRNMVVTIGKPMRFKGKTTKPAVKKVIRTVWKEVTKLARISHS